MSALPPGLHPLPPGLWCVPSALVLLTGADWESVVHPSINRHQRAAYLHDVVVGVPMAVAADVLRELGYHVRHYRRPDLRAQVRTWAARSLRYPGRNLLVATDGRDAHCLVIRDGRVYDNHAALGLADHPFARAVVTWCALVEKRT